MTQMYSSFGLGGTKSVYDNMYIPHNETSMLIYFNTIDDGFWFIAIVTSMLTCPLQKTSFFWAFFPPLLYLSCSHCYAFPSAVSVRRSRSWKHPQSCIFVNCRGSGSGGRWGGVRGGGAVSVGKLTHFPTPDPESSGWWKCTVAGLCVCVCMCVCVYVYRWVCRLSKFQIYFPSGMYYKFCLNGWNTLSWD